MLTSRLLPLRQINNRGSNLRGIPPFAKDAKMGHRLLTLDEVNSPLLFRKERKRRMRARIRDRKMERVADLKNFRQTGYWSVWLGLAPDDSPLLLRNTGTQEIYALDWQAR